MIKCFNETYKAFNEEYYNLKNGFNSIKVNNTNSGIKNSHFNFPYNSQNNGEISYDIYVNSHNNSFFSLDLEFEGIEENQPIVTAKIINLNGPQDITVDILSGTNDCGDTKKILTSYFNEANYTMIIKYDTESNDINITDIIYVKDYTYNVKQYKMILVEADEDIIAVNGIEMDLGELVGTTCDEILIDNDDVKVKEKINSTSHVI